MEENNKKVEKTLLSGPKFMQIVSGSYVNVPELHRYYKREAKTIIIKNYIIQDPILLSEIYKDYHLLIEDCVFSNYMSFEHLVEPKNITISNSIIDELIINACTKIGVVTVQKNCDINKLVVAKSNLKNLYINDDVKIEELDFSTSNSDSIHIRRKCHIDTITFEGSIVSHIGMYNNIHVGGLYFNYPSNEVQRISINTSCRVDRFSIINHKKISGIEISKRSIIKEMLLDSVEIDFQTVSSDSKIIDLQISSSSKINRLSFYDSTAGMLRVWNNSTIQNTFINNAILDSITLYNCNIDTISIYHGSKIRSISIQKLESSINIEVNKSFIQELTLNNDRQIIGSIYDSIITNIHFKNSVITRESYLQLTNLEVNNLNINNTFIAGTFILNGITHLNNFFGFDYNDSTSNGNHHIQNDDFTFPNVPYNLKSSICIANSDLGKTQLINFNIKRFDKFEYKNSKMLEVFVADTEFPSRQNIYHPDKEATQSQILEQQRLALSQFKKIYENRGDNIRATQALAEEVETYRAQLKLEKPSTRKERWNNRTERFNLWLNRISNYHGNNWFRAMLVTLGVNSLLFMLYSLSIGNRPGMDVSKFFTLAAYSLEFLNPLRKADFLKHDMPGECEGLSVFIDYLSRIIIAYFVYQTIAAFRKFGKKSG